jgi:cytochrome P450
MEVVVASIPSSGMRFGRAPGAWPLLGHVVGLQRRPLRLLDSLPAYGDLVEIRLGPRRAYVVCHPDLARKVLTDFATFDRSGPVYDRIRAAMGSGLATAAYQDHRRQRLVMQPAFRREHLRGYAAVMGQEITALMDSWRDGNRVDLVPEMFKLTTTVGLKALFSSQISSREAEELRDAFDVFLRGIYTRAALPAAGRLPTPGNRRYASAVARWRGQVTRLIDRYRREGAEHDDLMSRLLAARDEQGQPMTEQELSDQVAVLLLAGGETTSAAVTWSLHLLHRHPDILAALQTETSTVLGGDTAGWGHLPHLNLTARIVRETLRLYPPAWVIARTTASQARLAGQSLPAGTMVIFSPYLLHRHPGSFPHPHRFDPSRWLTPADGAAPAHHGGYLPFGAGATKCIGEQFGLTEATLALATITARWNLTPEPGTTISPAARAILVPKTLPVRLSDRSAH